MVFCNERTELKTIRKGYCHNPYFNRWFSAITNTDKLFIGVELVTILILIDGFLQYMIQHLSNMLQLSHNPYFNRWFSAITSGSKQSL